jgi:hypothetical protein
MENISSRQSKIHVSLGDADNTDRAPTPYETLGLGDIRLVTLARGSLEDRISIWIDTVNLTKQPDYAALSYVWNPKDGSIDPTRSPEPVYVTNFPEFFLKVASNAPASIVLYASSPLD